jgi:hypothetical protein
MLTMCMVKKTGKAGTFLNNVPAFFGGKFSIRNG